MGRTGSWLPLLFLGLSLLSVGVERLQAEEQSFTVSTGLVDGDVDPFRIRQLPPVPQFDPSFGDLESITVDSFSILTSDVTGRNKSNGSNTIKAELFGHFTLSGPGFSSSVRDYSLSGSGTVGGGEEFRIPLSTGEPTRFGTVVVPVGSLGDYIGEGNFTLSAEFLLGDKVEARRGSDSVTTWFPYDGSATATVTYRFHPVPEPHGIGSLFLAIVCYLTTRRRRGSMSRNLHSS